MEERDDDCWRWPYFGEAYASERRRAAGIPNGHILAPRRLEPSAALLELREAKARRAAQRQREVAAMRDHKLMLAVEAMQEQQHRDNRARWQALRPAARAGLCECVAAYGRDTVEQVLHWQLPDVLDERTEERTT